METHSQEDTTLTVEDLNPLAEQTYFEQPSSEKEPESSNETIIDELDSEDERAMDNAVAAMNRLVDTLGTAEKSLFKIVSFKGDGTEDPVDWINEFE